MKVETARGRIPNWKNVQLGTWPSHQ